MKGVLKLAVGVCVVLAALAQTAAADAAAGKWKAQTCLGCHGVASYTNVYPTYHVPRLGGQHADYIVAALKAYQAGERDHDTMVAQSHRLEERDMVEIANYFAAFESAPAQPQMTVPPEVQPLVATCAACHGNDGNSPISLYPKIAGQRENYLYNSMLDYKTGKRSNPIMRGIVATLDERGMKILSKYFAANPGLSKIKLNKTHTVIGR